MKHKTSLLTVLLASSLVTFAQASANPSDELTGQASSSTPAAQTAADLTPAVSDDVLTKLIQGQQAVKEAMRAALEKKLASEYEPLDTMREQLSTAGVEDDVATKTFENYFITTFQKGLMTDYISKNPLQKDSDDHYSYRSKARDTEVTISWCAGDRTFVVDFFGALPLTEWVDQWKGGFSAQTNFMQLAQTKASNSYVFGMTKSAHIYGRGTAYFTQIRTHLSQKKEEYRLMTFGR